jgi:hypothetical protein
VTIINQTNDGRYPELIVLFRAVAHLREVQSDELVRICFPDFTTNTEIKAQVRLRAVVSRWTELGLFINNDGKIQIDSQFTKGKKESLEEFTERLPSFCRQLVFNKKNCLPLWGESDGVSADYVRGITWLLAQDIYGFPTTWDGFAEDVERTQFTGGKVLIQNSTRWNGLRSWARYLGFATGDSGAFQIDPTVAVREELPSIFGSKKEIPAKDFLLALGSRLPVLDFGSYRKDVESKLDQAIWRKPSEGHLSMSLSLALKRLDLDKTIRLSGKADTGSSYRLTGRNYRTWMGFETVAWAGGNT